MGANVQTSVPAFTSGQVLTAAQVTQINTGIPVFASSTERDAAFGGTGEKTLAEGQMAYLEDTNDTQVYDGSAWSALGGGGLELVASTTVSGVTSALIDNCFTSNYQNYVVRWSATALASSLQDIRVQFRSGGTTDTGSIYKNRTLNCTASSTANATFLDTNFLYFVKASPTYLTFATATLYGPNLASDTGWLSRSTGHENGGANVSGSLANSTTQYDGIRFYHAAGGTFSGTFDVFGVND